MAYRWGEPGQQGLWRRVVGDPVDDPTPEGDGADGHDEPRASRRSLPRARDIRPELRLIIGALDLAPDDRTGRDGRLA